MKSFRAEDETISSADLPELLNLMKYERSEEQVKQYVDFWDTNFGGRARIDIFCNIMLVQHDRYQLLREYAISFDTDKDGFISREEFEFGVKTLKVHDPSFAEVTYDQLLVEADSNADGKISIDEVAIWIMSKKE